jgi:hypothetical protein
MYRKSDDANISDTVLVCSGSLLILKNLKKNMTQQELKKSRRLGNQNYRTLCPKDGSGPRSFSDPNMNNYNSTYAVHELFLCRLSQYSAVILSLLMIFFCFIAHWLACIWFVIGFYQDADNKMGKVNFVHF